VPFISLATKLDIVDGKAKTEIDIENGVEIITSPIPCVISAAKGMAEARIPNMRGIMTSRTKNIDVVNYQPSAQLVNTVKFTLPNPKSSVKLVDAATPEKLVELLHSEAKVI
jgi:electron transfer flavoprotein beta subunit